MNRLLRTALAAAGAITLAGCNLLHAPSDAIMKQCLAVGSQRPLDIPLSAYAEWAEAHGHELHWKHLNGANFIVRFRPNDAPPEADSEIGLELRNSDVPSDRASCGPGSIIIVRASVNGQVLDSAGMITLTDRLIEMLRDHITGRQAPSAAIDTPDASPPTQIATNEMRLDEETEAEGQYYAERAQLALKSPIQVTEDLATYYCCITLQTIVDDFRRHGAVAKVSTADSGAVWVEVRDPKGSWRGWTDLELEFQPPYPENNILVLSSIKNSGREVANVNADGMKSTNNVLRERFKLRATSEPTS